MPLLWYCRSLNSVYYTEVAKVGSHTPFNLARNRQHHQCNTYVHSHTHMHTRTHARTHTHTHTPILESCLLQWQSPLDQQVYWVQNSPYQTHCQDQGHDNPQLPLGTQGHKRSTCKEETQPITHSTNQQEHWFKLAGRRKGLVPYKVVV